MTTSQVRKLQGTAPTALAAAAVAGGGAFTAGAQFWKVTALGPWGESAPSAEATVSVALNGHADLTWACPPGTSAVRVYRGSVTNTENILVTQLQGNPTAYSDLGGPGTPATSPPAVSNWAAMSKSGTQPTKANIPAGTPAGLAQALYQAMCEWTSVGTATTAGVSQQAKLGDKLAAGAGFDLQEV